MMCTVDAFPKSFHTHVASSGSAAETTAGQRDSGRNKTFCHEFVRMIRIGIFAEDQQLTLTPGVTPDPTADPMGWLIFAPL